MPKENTPKELSQFELIIPAKKFLDAMVSSTQAFNKQKMTEKRLKEMKLTLGAINAYVKSFQTKVGYFKIVGVSEKVKEFKKLGK